MSVVVNRPCEDCVHAVVCGIRARLEDALGAGDATITPPIEDPALTFDVSIDVSCRHYLGIVPQAPMPSLLSVVPTVDVDKGDEVEGLLQGAGATMAPFEQPAVDAFQRDPFAEKPPAPATVPLTVERLTADGHAPAQPVRCDRCGRTFRNGTALTSHQKFCGQPLTTRQQALVDALRENHGNQKAAADALGKGTGWVSGMLGTIRRKRALPPDVEQLIASRPRGTNVGIVDKHRRQLQEAEEQARQAARIVAERARERESEAVAAHDQFVATREARARERANANMAQRRGERS